MAQPPRYERKKNFTVNTGTETDHVALNAELDGAAKSINGIRANLALIQRDDGGLVQGIVTADSVESDFADELSGKVSSGVQGALDDAKASALAATLAANAADTSRNAAAGSATSSSTSASAAASSASSAALSAGNSTTKATEAAASAAAAAASKDAAAASEANAAGSATTAAMAATNADLSAGYAATSATNSANSATDSANSASNSEASAAAAASAYDDFDRRFLGAKAADPTVDNDGQPLQTGAMYWNTPGNEMRVWSGTAWLTVTPGIPLDGSVSKQKFNQTDVTPFAQSVLDDTGADAAKRTLLVDPAIFPISASVANNAMSLTLQPCAITFRSSTPGSGEVNTRVISSPISTTISAGSTGGIASGVPDYIYLLAMDNAGTVELAWLTMSGTMLNESGLLSTTAEGGAANSRGVPYSTVARSGLPYRVLGYMAVTQATAGMWVTPPSIIVGGGGITTASLGSLGVGQTWTYMSPSRSASVTYTNLTGRPIVLSLGGGVVVAGNAIQVFINGVVTAQSNAAYSNNAWCYVSGVVVPHGATYAIATSAGAAIAGLTWYELR